MYLVNSFLLIFFLSTVKCFSNRFGHRFLLEEFDKTIYSNDSLSIDTKWIEQPLDHFNETDDRKWKMRYLQNLEFWKTSGPIYFFMKPGERITDEYIEHGLMYELAKETNGAMFTHEQRYHGESKPFKDYTPENLKFLTFRQVLADIARLIENIKNRPEFANSKVVFVGMIYGANLAAWFQLFYPNLVDATVASCAPVKAKTDFYEIYELIGENLKKYGSLGCYEKVEHIFKEFEKKFETKDGIEQLKKQFQICPESDLTKLENKQYFYTYVLYLYGNPASYGTVDDIKEFCEDIEYNNLIINENILTWNKTRSCFKCEFDFFIQIIKESHDYKADLYQACTEFGHFKTTSSENQPFTKNLPVDYFFKLCTATFGKEFGKKRIEEGVKKTNDMYGGLHPNVSKVVFVNGELDPQRIVSVLKDISSEAPAKVIPLSPGCRDLSASNEKDPEELKTARKYIKNLVKKWIGLGEEASPKKLT